MASATRALSSLAANFTFNPQHPKHKPHFPTGKCGLVFPVLQFDCKTGMKPLSNTFRIVTLLIAATNVAAHPQASQIPQIQQIFARAEQALRTGDYIAAESGFRRVLQDQPSNIAALGNLGVVYAHTHRYARAVEIYRRALRISPRDQDVLLNLGLAYLKQDDYANALPYFRQLHLSNPANL